MKLVTNLGGDMKLNTQEDLFKHELKDLYSAETQITAALPKLINVVQNPNLKQLLERHLEETRTQVARLSQISESLGEKLDDSKCIGMAGLLEEGDKIANTEGEAAIKDKALNGGSRKVEHYEILTYNSAIKNARDLGYEDFADLLQKSLDEEIRMDEDLEQLE